MIQEFVNIFMDKKDQLAEKYRQNLPSSYKQLVEDVITMISNSELESNGVPDPKRITCINHGDYQGTMVFVIGATGYQPSTHWYVRIYYGSCSGCDSFQKITQHWKTDGTGYAPDVDRQVDEFITLCLHIVQRIKQMDSDAMF